VSNPETSTELTGESITAEGLAELRAEVEELEGTGRKEMAERIKNARELGDLKENADYHIAKEDQAHLETRIKRLRMRLRDAVVVEVDAAAATYAFGRTADILDVANGKVHRWTLVGPTEADTAAGRISAESPVGRALRDHSAGDSVAVETPGGKKTFKVQKLVD
jgi:transcription elongation factor GreA